MNERSYTSKNSSYDDDDDDQEFEKSFTLFELIRPKYLEGNNGSSSGKGDSLTLNDTKTPSLAEQTIHEGEEAEEFDQEPTTGEPERKGPMKFLWGILTAMGGGLFLAVGAGHWMLERASGGSDVTDAPQSMADDAVTQGTHHATSRMAEQGVQESTKQLATAAGHESSRNVAVAVGHESTRNFGTAVVVPNHALTQQVVQQAATRAAQQAAYQVGAGASKMAAAAAAAPATVGISLGAKFLVASLIVTAATMGTVMLSTKPAPEPAGSGRGMASPSMAPTWIGGGGGDYLNRSHNVFGGHGNATILAPTPAPSRYTLFPTTALSRCQHQHLVDCRHPGSESENLGQLHNAQDNVSGAVRF